jgi:thymidylate synthase
MHVIDATNVHTALPEALIYLGRHGVQRDSRNGPVLVAPGPVSTVYRKPMQRVLFWPERDANPFFHLYEALWMLAGRNDVAGPSAILKSFAQFSDDGETFHGAYGHRWRGWFPRADEHGHVDNPTPVDQLPTIIAALKANPDDRRCMLQMWDPVADLGRVGKDVPCNQSAAFMINDGKLDMTVFCRSNDIIWGCYGANAVHFAFLLEYMALKIGVPPGVYTQVSVNWHAYQNSLYERVRTINTSSARWSNPYVYDNNLEDEGDGKRVHYVPMPENIDELIPKLLKIAEVTDPEALCDLDWDFSFNPWATMVSECFAAYVMYKHGDDDPEDTQGEFDGSPDNADWVVACRDWLWRRRAARAAKA